MKKVRFQFWVLIVLAISSFCSCTNEIEIQDSDWWYVMEGDSIKWAQKDFDHSDWKPHVEDDYAGVFWVRLNIDLKKTRKNQCILIGAIGSYDAYWDGTFVGKNGQLRIDGNEEIPGQYWKYIMLQDSMVQKGKHTLALRSTKTRSELSNHAYFTIGDYKDITQVMLKNSLPMFLLAGGFLISAIYFFMLFLMQRKEISFLLFSGICSIFFVLLIFEYLKFYYNYDYPFQLTRLQVIAACHYFLAALVPFFFMIQFNFPWKKIGMGIIISSILIIEIKYRNSFDAAAMVQNILLWISSFGIVAYSAFKKIKGALISLGGVILSILIIFTTPYFPNDFISSFDVTLFIAFIVIILSMLYMMTVRRREDRLAYEASLVVSERLKNELLKKNIKPHFIMNTLTSLIDWVEESPKEGVSFITALADEFEVLNQIADYKQVPIDQEIKLCKSHLKVMGFRKEIDYVWEQFGIDSNEIIPPAIIHTAVENGVTHSLPDENGKIKFRLFYSKDEGVKKYLLKTIAKNRPVNDSITSVNSGTGMKYIKARLQESYPDKWEVTSNAPADGWETCFIINT